MVTKTQKKIQLQQAFRVIQLELAREAKHPAGSREYGYRMVVPLDKNGRIDLDLWKQYRDACKVVRFRPNEEDDVGHLVRNGTGWGFHYDVHGDDLDEAGYRLGDERFEIGEYVSIGDDKGTHTYRVISVEHI